MKKYQRRLPPPSGQTPTDPRSQSWPSLVVRKSGTKVSIQSLTQCRTSLHRIHGLSLNTTTNRVFTTSQLWHLIYRGKPGYRRVLSKTKEVESRSNGDLDNTFVQHPPLLHPVFHQSRSQRAKLIGLYFIPALLHPIMEFFAAN